MDSSDAKQFLISRVIEEADLQHVTLSDIEKKMLHFTESHPTLPDIHGINAEFERNYDSDEYEAKIAGLLKHARDRDKEASPSREQEWKDVLQLLRTEDHYILVMVGQAFGVGLSELQGNSHRTRDSLIYIAVGIAIVLILVWFSMR
jgi:hypothetical protein